MGQRFFVRGQFREENFAFQIGDEIFPVKFLRNLGALPTLCVSSAVAVARYCCAVVGSQSVCHVCSSCLLGSEKLVVKNVRELGLRGKKAAFFLQFFLVDAAVYVFSPHEISPPVSMALHQNWRCDEIFR